jgi:hypothetical protein
MPNGVETSSLASKAVIRTIDKGRWASLVATSALGERRRD